MSYSSVRSAPLFIGRSHFPLLFYSLFNAIRHSKKTDVSEEQRSHAEPMHYGRLAQQTVAFYILYFALFFAAKADGSHFLATDPLLAGLVFTIAYTHNTINIQVAHVTKHTYNPWTKLYLFNVGACALMITLGLFNL